MTAFLAGSAVRDITPEKPLFLFGYPHVQRVSEGVHDPLLSSALYMSDGVQSALFSANDIIFVPQDVARKARRRIADATGVSEPSILISATHTHSGPVTVSYVSNMLDPAVPRPDLDYLSLLEERIVESCVAAVRCAKAAEAAFCVAQVRGTGTNRHDPAGPADPETPVLLVRSVETGESIACMAVHAMHPTVLHEDSRLVSGDFTGLARQHILDALGAQTAFLLHNGASGNQSPRHVTRGNTFDEAQRLGRILADGIIGAAAGANFTADVPIQSVQAIIRDLTRREFPSDAEAMRGLEEAKARLDGLCASGAPRPEVRTAECDLFGAEETVALSRAADDGVLDRIVRKIQHAEIQAFRIGPWRYVGWLGEYFVEYALELRSKAPSTYLISMANGELQGYITTEEAARRKTYESGNALFPPSLGQRMLDETLTILARL
ncbi:MAG: neutral/alkaline non-lysosomal ceramidase N-terminal domain-containing protein [bacterium]|nr:neutral/alkaline non-lysosomal ceramidase N-terminal domain-containing protein [Candidatus Sumerlaeota bacterium]